MTQSPIDEDLRASSPCRSLKPVLARLAAGSRLTEAESQAAFELVMSGGGTDAQIAALVMALRVRGETVPELLGAVRAMRARMRVVPGVADAIDVCGTGGDGHSTLNISTAVAFVLAALGVPVAKHGNRAVSSRAGAFDTLEALGIPIIQDPDLLEASLQMNGLTFLAANLHHPAMRHAATVRSELGLRTIFNLLGPLCNPASVRRQMIGVFDPEWQEPIARTLQQLGADCVWVVHGEDADGTDHRGLDELGLAGPNRIVALDQGRLCRFSVTPEELGLPRHPVAAIAGGDAVHNARALERLLAGEPGAYRDTVLLNAAAALQVSARGSILANSGTDVDPGDGVAEIEAPIETLLQGLRHAARVLDDGSALAVLDSMRAPDAAGNAGRSSGLNREADKLVDKPAPPQRARPKALPHER
ncbi:anthranilate phosphoribosyltransferase [Lichenicola sp.]|uniref:anthranilate phosphoribosyltransferase n=1 Tax=Lichenicola sp. TaxID=2804529 RepID=UPI003B006384